MKTRVYKVLRDYGFAPNPFHGVCTLACCKPKIREHASIGDWIIGVGSKTNGMLGRVVYAMEVEKIITFDQYWDDSQYSIKKPIIGGTHKMFFGDNIYHKDCNGEFIQENSHHSNPDGSTNEDNLVRDTGTTENVLISTKYVYFGKDAATPPDHVTVHLSEEFPKDVRQYNIKSKTDEKIIKEWLLSYEWDGYLGHPEAWKNAMGRRGYVL